MGKQMIGLKWELRTQSLQEWNHIHLSSSLQYFNVISFHLKVAQQNNKV
jgi:hypothetical protein